MTCMSIMYCRCTTCCDDDDDVLMMMMMMMMMFWWFPAGHESTDDDRLHGPDRHYFKQSANSAHQPQSSSTHCVSLFLYLLTQLITKFTELREPRKRYTLQLEEVLGKGRRRKVGPSYVRENVSTSVSLCHHIAPLLQRAARCFVSVK